LGKHCCYSNINAKNKRKDENLNKTESSLQNKEIRHTKVFETIFFFDEIVGVFGLLCGGSPRVCVCSFGFIVLDFDLGFVWKEHKKCLGLGEEETEFGVTSAWVGGTACSFFGLGQFWIHLII